MLNYNFEVKKFEKKILKILKHIQSFEKDNKKSFDDKELAKLLRKYTKTRSKLFSKDELVQGYYYLIKQNKLSKDNLLLQKIRLKPTRSRSGVLPVTVLTKPYACPGKCIFCPLEAKMPKSYLKSEPGAQRAVKNKFDPFWQTFNRMLAYKNIGHEISKIELIILGGTWSFYSKEYQIWFITRCFEAMNAFGSQDHKLLLKKIKNKNINYQDSSSEFGNNLSDKKHKSLNFNNNFEKLFIQHKKNEIAQARCIGLVIETRPDFVTKKACIFLRKLGVTKVQIGIQSLNNKVLKLNKRGHDVETVKKAFKLLRQSGFKIHAHWMPNLYGSNLQKDKKDFMKLWSRDFYPDELKIYPCSLISSAPLMKYYEKKLWKPYTEENLKEVLIFALKNTPRTVRVTRVIRDIPSPDIVVGNKKTNFRQIVENEIKKNKNIVIKEIRSREIRDKFFNANKLKLKKNIILLNIGQEIFLEFITKDDNICGFLRLFLPDKKNTNWIITELKDSAIIREVHVYGILKKIGEKNKHALKGKVQHIGLGTKLIQKAEKIAYEKGYKKISVISAIGTRNYYKNLGYYKGELYQYKNLLDTMFFS